MGKTINIDGHATTGAYLMALPASRETVRAQLPWMPLRAGSMPYVVLGDSPSVLCIGPGGGLDILNGLYYGATIQGVELNGLIFDLMTGRFREWSGNVYNAPGVSVVHDEARSWISRSTHRYDLIQASMIDTWAATAGGAFSLAENSLYTVEAFLEYWDHLTPGGVVHFLRWHEEPPRQSLRLVALAVEAMRRRDVRDFGAHLVVLEEPNYPFDGNPMASLLWAKTPFPKERLAVLRTAIAERQKIGAVKYLHWPGEEYQNEISRYVTGKDFAKFHAAYPFDVAPTTDDRPFFFHTRRFSDLVDGGIGSENEQAIAVLANVLVVVLGVAFAAFILPFVWVVFRRRVVIGLRGVGRLGYFCCLGIGFMLAEMPFLQSFMLFMGHPAWTLSTVVGALLLGAAAGGRLTHSVTTDSVGGVLRWWLMAVVVVLGVALIGTPSLTYACMDWSFGARLLLTGSIMFSVGVPLGGALPLGVKALCRHDESLLPWAWGLNGIMSVVGSVLAVGIAMTVGFQGTILCGLACYVVAALIAWRCMR